MWSMQRTRLWGSALLTIVLTIGAAAPSASATDADSTVPQPNWGSCAAFFGDTSDIPTARCAMVVNALLFPAALRSSGRRPT